MSCLNDLRGFLECTSFIATTVLCIIGILVYFFIERRKEKRDKSRHSKRLIEIRMARAFGPIVPSINAAIALRKDFPEMHREILMSYDQHYMQFVQDHYRELGENAFEISSPKILSTHDLLVELRDQDPSGKWPIHDEWDVY